MLMTGKCVADAIFQNFGGEAAESVKQRPYYLGIRTDENSDQHYLKALKKAAARWGIQAVEYHGDESIEVKTGCSEFDITPSASILSTINLSITPYDSYYDIDGASEASATRLILGEESRFHISNCLAATPQAILLMLDYYGVPLEGRHMVIIGRSIRVGKPLALLAMERNATVSIAHSATPKGLLDSLVYDADIIVEASGAPDIVNFSNTRACGQTIVDVGGGVNKKFAEIAPCIGNYSPYIGGVGPITTEIIMAQTFGFSVKL